MSEVKVNKITPTADCGTVTLGDSGDTVTIPAGVTLTSGGALTNSGTITNTGTITGVSITGTIDNQVNWQTTVKTANFTATAGEGYFCNTTSGAFTVTLPSSPSAGDLVGIKDYANTADTNNITIGRNGSNIEGVANNFVISVEGGSITLIYVDATKGWLSTAAAKASDISSPLFVTATGGTITTSGDFKIHTFTGPGTFSVSCAGNPSGSNTVSYMVVAGGGGGGAGEGVGDPTAVTGGGGGAGGFREGKSSFDSYTASPLNAPAGLPVSATGYPITVGAGGSGTPGSPPREGANGSASIFSSITSAGGGGTPGATGGTGGSGGGVRGACSTGNVGAGNTPPVSPPQGNPGGVLTVTSSPYGAAGGGGATAAGGTNGPSGTAGTGGNGATTSISGSPTAYAGGGGGGEGFPGTTSGAGGTGGGGGGSPPYDGSTNTGGGGGGGPASPGTSGSGGSGIVVIRYKFQ
jgi:hypothetical protein